MSFMSCVVPVMATSRKAPAGDQPPLCQASTSHQARRRDLGHSTGATLRSGGDGGSVTLPAQHRLDCTLVPDREYDDRHPALLGKREGGLVHDPQIALERLPIGQAV